MDQKTDDKKWSELIDRMWKSGIRNLLIISSLGGLALFFVGFIVSSGLIWDSHKTIGGFIEKLGEASIIAAIVGFIYDYYAREIKEEKEKQLLEKQTDRIIKEIPKTLTLNKDVRERIIHELSPSKLTSSFNESLARILKSWFGDEDGEKISEILSTQVFKYESVAETTTHDVFLESPTDKKDFYDISIIGEYFKKSRVISEDTKFKFVCTSNIETWMKLLKDESVVQAWYLENIKEIDESWFGVNCWIFVGEKRSNLKKEQSKKDRDLYYEYSIDKKDLNNLRNEELIKVRFTLKTKLHLKSNYYAYKTDFLQRGLHITFNDHTQGYITNIMIFESFLSKENPDILYKSAPQGYIKIGSDGWVLPKSEVVFVWQNKKNLET